MGSNTCPSRITERFYLPFHRSVVRFFHHRQHPLERFHGLPRAGCGSIWYASTRGCTFGRSSS
jgi:hypothetical protein